MPFAWTPHVPPSSASCFILCGLALWWQRRPMTMAPPVRGIVASAATFVVALVVVAPYLFPALSARGPLAELAELLPGQMPFGSAANFLLLAIALRLLHAA